MQIHNKLTARLLSLVMSIAMVTTMTSATVFAAEGDVPLGRSSGAGVSGITVDVNGTSSDGATLQEAVGKVPGGAAAVTSLHITAGKVTEDDWKYLASLTALTTFEIDAAVTQVADIPANEQPDGSFINLFPTSIETVKVPQAITIGQYAFRYCDALTTADFLGATSIGSYTFLECTSLTSINFPAVTSIGEQAFSGCTALTSATFPKVSSIGVSAFSGCIALTSANFSKVTTISENAFQDCTKLATLKLGVTPPTTVGTDAFKNCPATRGLGYVDADGNELTGDALKAAVDAYKAIADTNGKWYDWKIEPPKVRFTATIDGVETKLFGDSLELGLKDQALGKVTTLTITAGEVTTADWNYLKNLPEMTSFEIADDAAVTDVANIPDGILGEQNFPRSIVSVTVPQAVTIGELAFNNCLLLTTASFSAATSIGENAFAACAALTTVSFPAATTIGDKAFNGCRLLTTVSFPAATSIGKTAFQGCQLLTTVSFPAATSIGEAAFYSCKALTSASFPKVTDIGENAFENCIALATLKLGATVPTTVGTDAFKKCPDTRALGYVDADGNDLTGTALTNAQAAYKAFDDGDTTDGKWYGWTIVPSTPTHKPVTNITGVPTTAVAGTDLTLTGTVAPTDATNKTIVWSVKDAGTTGATIDGNVLTTTAVGTVTVTATITNGLTASSNYTQDFTITVSAPKTPSSIAVTTPPTKTAYTTGQTFDKTGMVITATYVDSTTAAVSGYTFSPTTALATSDTTITISYTENGTTVTTTQTITVTDTPTTHTITASASAGGSISPTGTVTVNNGESKTFTISANSNYSIASVTVDGVSQGAISTYTFSNVTGNHTISATFSYNGGGGGDSGGSSSSAPSNTIYSAEGNKGASNVISQAIKNAIATGGTNVSTSATFNNFDFLAPDGLKTINEIAAKESAGKTVKFTVNFDAGPKEPVNSRITVNPAALAKELTAKNITGKLPLGVWFDQTKDTKVQSVNTLFGKHFSNKIVSVVYDRNSTLAVNAEFCAKLNLTKTFGTDKNLYFYTYDNTTNIYRRIQSPGYRVDRNGYAHITAPFGGSIIITDKPLTSK